jgi:hypothetical protein
VNALNCLIAPQVSHPLFPILHLGTEAAIVTARYWRSTSSTRTRMRHRANCAIPSCQLPTSSTTTALAEKALQTARLCGLYNAPAAGDLDLQGRRSLRSAISLTAHMSAVAYDRQVWPYHAGFQLTNYIPMSRLEQLRLLAILIQAQPLHSATPATHFAQPPHSTHSTTANTIHSRHELPSHRGSTPSRIVRSGRPTGL